jgi:hypothetical protein
MQEDEETLSAVDDAWSKPGQKLLNDSSSSQILVEGKGSR